MRNAIRSGAKSNLIQSVARNNLSRFLAITKGTPAGRSWWREAQYQFLRENSINESHLRVRAPALGANAAADLRCAETQCYQVRPRWTMDLPLAGTSESEMEDQEGMWHPSQPCQSRPTSPWG